MSQELKSPAGITDEAKIKQPKPVSDYASPLSSTKVRPIPKYPVMALSHMAFDPLFIRGEAELRRLAGTPNEGLGIIVKYDGVPCLITIHRLDSDEENAKGVM